MKKSTAIALGVGAAALVGIYLYRKKKSDASTAASVGPVVSEVQTDLTQIQMPIAQDQKQIYLPGTLIEPTLPNTGIVPPAVVKQSIPTVAPASPIAQPTKVSRIAPSAGLVKSATVVAQKGRVPLKGLSGNAFILN